MKERVKLNTYNNQWYSPGRGALTRLIWYVINSLLFINPLNPISGLKVVLLRVFGAKIGAGVIIKPGVNIKYPWRLSIGDHSWIGEKVWIDNLADVTIGNHVCVSQEAMLLTGNHNYKSEKFDLIVESITLEDGSWIGARSTVCPGVRCEEHSVLAVGSIATTTLKAWTIYQGNPAQPIRKRTLNLHK